LTIARLPDSTGRENRDRVRADIRNSSFAIASRGPGMRGSTHERGLKGEKKS